MTWKSLGAPQNLAVAAEEARSTAAAAVPVTAVAATKSAARERNAIASRKECNLFKRVKEGGNAVAVRLQPQLKPELKDQS